MIPLNLYTPFWHHALLLIVFLTAFTYRKEQRMGWFLFLTLVLYTIFYMGMRPISGRYFGDMATYARDFMAYKSSLRLPEPGSEWGFHYFKLITAQFMKVESWILLCAAIYTSGNALAFARCHRHKAGVALLFGLASMFFWSFGTNGMRNGLATSILMLAFAFHDRKVVMAALFVLAMGFHNSSLLPIGAFLLTFVLRNSMAYLGIYLLCIFLSVTMGGWWESFFATSGLVEDARFTGYLTAQVNPGEFSSTGFRWDFLVYSLFPIATGAWFIFRKGFKDAFYLQLFHTYILCNAFWLLVIRANFSNRFAYLSWFMMSWVIAYPLLKSEDVRSRTVSFALLAYYGFTYLMFLKGY